MNEASIKQIPVDRANLIETLEANRDAHRAAFEEAMEGYKARAIKLLEDHIERIKKGAPERISFTLPWPEDHTEDYDLALEMLIWSTADEIWLDADSFDRYVRDNWFWKQEFANGHAAYTK